MATLEENKKFFKENGFGMMIHWGLYSILAGEYKGKRNNVIGEWIMSCNDIPIKEYEKLATCFNPVYFDAEEWCKLAIDAGMKYIVFTSKHHEGFAMYHSRVDRYNVVDATPFKRDVVKELSEACKKYGLKFGLYYSQELDWHEPDGGGYSCDNEPGFEHKPWSNNWDFPDKEKKDYTRCFERKIKPQVEEIMKNYGDIFLVWFDCPCDIKPEQSRELYELVRKYQPACLVNSRIGNGLGDYGSAGDNELNADKNQGLFEVPATLNDTWGYKAYDQNWKTPEQVYKNLQFLNKKGINYLLNVGPDYLGRIPAPSQDILREVGRKIKANK